MPKDAQAAVTGKARISAESSCGSDTQQTHDLIPPETFGSSFGSVCSVTHGTKFVSVNRNIQIFT